MAANAAPQTLSISSGEKRLEIKDILIGEVWALGGQSNSLTSWDQQMDWYHPRDKFPLGERGARWALTEVMQLKPAIPWKPAELVSIEFGTRPDPGEVVVTFDQPVRSHDGRPFRGFAVAGEDKHFYPAQAVPIEGGGVKFSKSVVVSCPLVKTPVALRFAWARNPWANLCYHALLPIWTN